jgi:hypothetical protein
MLPLKRIKNPIGILTFAICIFSFNVSCKPPGPEKPPLNIESVQMLGEGDRGKFMQVCLDHSLKARERYYYNVTILTKTAGSIEGGGILSGKTGVGDDSPCKEINLYNFVKRHDPKEHWDIIKNHCNRGNIQLVTIEVYKDKKLLFSKEFKNL